MADVFVGSRTHELRVFTGSIEDAREFAAALAVPADLEVRIVDDPEVTDVTSRIVEFLDLDHPHIAIAIADLYELGQELKRFHATIARAERLRDIWLTYPNGDMHHDAGLMLARYLTGEAFGSDIPASAPESPATAPTPPHPTHEAHHTHGDPQQTGGDT